MRKLLAGALLAALLAATAHAQTPYPALVSTPVTPANGGTGVANTGNLTWNAAQTLSVTSGQTMTFPATSATLARTDALQTFTGVQTFSSSPVFSVGIVAPGPIGGTTPGTGAFTTLSATGAFTASPANLNDVLSPTGTGVVTINPATLGTINNMSVGATTTSTGAFTTLTASASATFNLGINATGATDSLNVNSSNAVNIASGTSSGTVTIGNSGNPGKTVLAGLASSSAAQTGTVCIGASNILTFDTTTTCLLSDLRDKENIKPLDKGLAAVMALKPISYDVKASANPIQHALGRQVGLGAQDVEKVDPRLVSLYQSGPRKGTPSGVRYEQLTAVLVRALQEEEAQIVELKAELAAKQGLGCRK